MLIIAIKQSSRPIFVPMFAILVATLIFGGILQKMEPETFPDVFDSMFAPSPNPQPPSRTRTRTRTRTPHPSPNPNPSP